MNEAVLKREDTGERLVIDGLLSASLSRDVLLPVHPVEDQTVVTDNAQRRQLVVSLSVLFSEIPAVGGLQSGPARMAEVLGFLDAVSFGVALTFVQSGMAPISGLRVAGFQLDRSKPELRGPITLAQIPTATRATVEVDTTRAPDNRTRTARPDVADGWAAAQDRGAQPTKTVDKSLAKGIFDVASGGGG